MKRAITMLLAACLILTSMGVLAASNTAQQTFHNEEQKGEIIFPVTEMTGEWGKSSTIKNYDGGEHVWSAQSGGTLTFAVSGIEAGNYELYYWVAPHINNAEKMEFVVSHNGKNSGAFVYQKLDDGEQVAPGWVSMGVFDFAGSGEEKVVHTCAGQNTRGTGVKLVPTTKEVTATEAVGEEKKPTQPATNNGALSHEIDVEPVDGFTWQGNWQFSSKLQGPMTKAPGSMWIAGATEKDYCQYDPDIYAVGDVRISVYLLYWHENQTTDVKYEVHHNDKVDTFHFDMTKLTENKWETLGTFDFAGTGGEFVRVVGTNTGNEMTNTRASAVAFEIMNPSNGDVWQTKYVSASQTQAQKKIIANFREEYEKIMDAFDDTRDHWAKDDIGYMAHEGLIQGVADRIFEPESTITRAEFITILDRAMGYEPVEEDSFADVAKDEWYYTYIAAANKNGLLKDFPAENGFLPNQPITREEMALVIYNAVQATGRNDEWVKTLPDDYANFTDTDKVSDYAKTALQYLIQTGIIKGTSDTTVSPEETANRAQAAVILKRFMQSFVWAGPPTDEEWVLTFNDEFLGDDLNWDVWVSDSSAPGHILSSRWPENVAVNDGALYLLNKKESKGGKEWTTGSVWVNPDVFRQSYGYWEARYKVSAASGINNSFWMMSDGIVQDTRQKFEIDINEGHYPNRINTNYHTSYSGQSVQHSEQYYSEYDLSADYHTYALEWNEDELIYYFDGKVIHTKKNENANIPLFPYFSSAAIGNWAGPLLPEADGTAQVADYVRIWQRKADAENPERTLFNQPVKPVTATPAPSDDASSSLKVSLSEQQVDSTAYPGELIIPCEVEGDWQTSSTFPNYNGKEHYWTSVKGAVSKYSLKDVPAGEYKVYFWRMPHHFNVPQMDFMLFQDGAQKAAGSAAMKSAEGEQAESGWVLLGTQALTGDKNAYIGYTCIGQTCRATAIKLVPVK